ncbi:MAG: phage major capsid protein [Bacillota bacterium]
MKLEDLRKLIKEVVGEQIAPLQQAQRQYADALNNQAPPPEATPQPKGEQLEPGIRLARCAKLMVLGKNDPERALHYASNEKNGMYPNDTELHNALKSMAAGTPSDGGFLIPEQYANEIIPLLRAKTIVRKLGARSLPLAGGNLNIPKLTGGATSYYLGELQDAKKSKPSLGNIRLSGKKLVTLVPMSNDLIRNNSYNADAMVRDDMLQSMALKEDYTAMYGSGTEFTPKGIKNVAGITTNALNAVPSSDDLAAMIGVMLTKNLPWSAPGWGINGALWSVLYNLKDGVGNYIHRQEMNQGKFLGLPFAISNQITYNNDINKSTEIFLADWSEFIIGEEMGLEIMASNEATYHDGTQLVSAFSTDQTVLKVTAKHDFGVRHPEAFYVKTGVYTVA